MEIARCLCPAVTKARKRRNIFNNYICFTHIRWAPCHHGMARPQVADGGDGLQMCKIAANTLNKQSRAAENGWFSSLGVRHEANNS
jgi:hypothetical protein